MEYDDHDPWNDSSHRHPRADELMQDEVLWSCVNELAPFGSDEGADAYVEYRRWRAQNLGKPLMECLSWILGGRQSQYNESLVQDAVMESHTDDSDAAVLGLSYPD